MIEFDRCKGCGEILGHIPDAGNVKYIAGYCYKCGENMTNKIIYDKDSNILDVMLHHGEPHIVHYVDDDGHFALLIDEDGNFNGIHIEGFDILLKKNGIKLKDGEDGIEII